MAALLDAMARLGREDGARVHVEGLRQEPIRSVADAARLIAAGAASRMVGGTSTNAESSRSHAVLTLRLTAELCGAADGLKRERNQRKFRAVAEQRGLGPLVPFRRKCGGCAELGWSTWPGSPQARWTCCGCDAHESKADCDERMGQRPPRKPRRH